MKVFFCIVLLLLSLSLAPPLVSFSCPSSRLFLKWFFFLLLLFICLVSLSCLFVLSLSLLSLSLSIFLVSLPLVSFFCLFFVCLSIFSFSCLLWFLSFFFSPPPLTFSYVSFISHLSSHCLFLLSVPSLLITFSRLDFLLSHLLGSVVWDLQSWPDRRTEDQATSKLHVTTFCLFLVWNIQ